MDNDLRNTALESLPGGVIVVGRDGRIALANAEARRIFGREDLVGREVEDLLPEELREPHRSRRAAFMSDPEESRSGERRGLRGLRADGTEVFLDIYLRPAGSGMVVAAVTDVTEREREIAFERRRLLAAIDRLATSREALSAACGRELGHMLHNMDRSRDALHGISAELSSQRGRGTPCGDGRPGGRLRQWLRRWLGI